MRELDVGVLRAALGGHDSPRTEAPAANASVPPPRCVVCAGRAGPVIDRAEGIDGHTFAVARSIGGDRAEFWQFCSTRHAVPFHALIPLDAVAVLERAAKIGRWMREHARELLAPGRAERASVVISKRRGPNGHDGLRVRLHAGEPAQHRADREDRVRHGSSRPVRIEIDGPDELLLGEFRGGLAAAVPREPERAFETWIWFRPGAVGSALDWTADQRWGMAQALREITGALHLELVRRRLPSRFQWSLHGGEGTDAYARIVTPPGTRVDDDPQTWAELLKAHVGLE